MRYLTLILVAAASVMITASAYADLGDQLLTLLCAVPLTSADCDESAKLVRPGSEDNDFVGRAVAIGPMGIVLSAPQVNGHGSVEFFKFDGTSWTHTQSVQPDDADTNDWYGTACDISGNVLVVGSQFHQTSAGAVYVYRYNGALWQFEQKLTAGDAAVSDKFGKTVCVHNDCILVGAEGDDPVGAAYIFEYDGAHWVQTQKLLPTDGNQYDQFGANVGLTGDMAVVSAPWHDAAEIDAGAAYVFRHDGVEFVEQAKLLPWDAGEDDNCGVGLSIDGDRIVLGSIRHDLNVRNEGAAYVFAWDGSVWMPEQKLIPSDPGPGHTFGTAVHILGERILVGSLDDDNGNGSGSVYVFQRGADVWAQTEKLLALDGEAGDSFGWSVDEDGTTVVVGAYLEDGNGGFAVGAGYVFECDADTDGDGLPDSWETDGIPIEGTNELYMLEGADPMRKDIYVEVDAMVGLAPDAAVRQMIIDAFANAPVQNPDGSTGITFHFDLDETELSTILWTLDLDTDNNGELDWVSGFDNVMNDHFGTSAEQGDAALLEAKGKAYRYCIFGHSYDPNGSGGIANGIPGHLFMVTLGQWGTYGGTTEQQAGTFMHELGHCLGLGHGGENDVHHKPNYYSVMNYSWQVPESNYPGWRLDYSRAALPTLDELALNEAAGLGAETGEFSGVFVPFNGPNGQIWLADMEGGLPIDWNLNGQIDQAAVQQDLNYLYSYQSASPDQILESQDDWSNLVYDFRGTPGYANGNYGGSTADSPFTYEMHVFLESIPAPGTGVVLESVNVDNGTYLDGDIPDITKPDDGGDYHALSGFGRTFVDAHHSEIRVRGTAINQSPALIDLIVESRIDQPNGLAQVRLFNWNTQQHVQVNQHSVGEENTRIVIENIDATNYVDPGGQVEVSIKHTVFVPYLAFTFESFIDQVQITVK